MVYLLCNLAKAFDFTLHSLVLTKKLSAFKFKKSCVNLFESYLNKQCQ